jgi:radical SAM superfamily enzyme YgiQ (UPF0313 family)
MKVLLISPNIESLPDPVFPIGLAYIAAALKANHTPYQILDLCFEEDYASAVSTAVSSFQPDVIGLSLRNVDNVSFPNYVSYLAFYRRVVQIVRKSSRGVIVLGGSGFDLLPGEILEYLDADLGVVGEGEVSFVKLVNRLEKEGFQTLESKILDGRLEVINNLDDLPFPDRSGFDNKAYLKLGGMGNIQTKRGCPFNCIYCTYPVIQGKKVRMRSPKHVCSEIEGLIEHGVSNVFIVDNEFNYPVEHAQSVCREIIRRKLSIKWSCYCHPGFVTRELVDLMLESGCTGMEFGSDAANDAMLVNMGKNFSTNDLRKASDICRQSDMPFCHSLLLGGPGETMETAKQTFNAIQDMAPTAVICMVGIRIFPGTKLYHLSIEEGVIDPDQDFLEPAFYISPAVENEILPFVENFSKENPTWIFPGLNINMSGELQKKLRRFGIKGPLWEYMKVGARFKNVNKLSKMFT